MDGLNEYRTARVAEILDEFRTIQYSIAAVPTEPANEDDHHTEGWAALRQCAIDGRYVLDRAAVTRVPVPPDGGGEEEQRKAELMQVHLDAYSRRHEGHKIIMRQNAAMRWVEWRDQVLQGGRPNYRNRDQLLACDHQLRAVNSKALQELAAITDEYIYSELQASDFTLGRWMAEDPSLREVKRWLRARR